MLKHKNFLLPINWIALRDSFAGCSQRDWQKLRVHPAEQKLRSSFSQWLKVNTYLQHGDSFLGLGSRDDDNLPFAQKLQLHLVDDYNISAKRSLVASPYYLPIASDFCDVALILFALNYSNHPQALLQEWARVVAEGGYLVIVNYQWWNKFKRGKKLQRRYISSFTLNKYARQCSLSLQQSKNFMGMQIRVYQKIVLKAQSISYSSHKTLPLAWGAN